jgi:hypothetical protein
MSRAQQVVAATVTLLTMLLVAAAVPLSLRTHQLFGSAVAPVVIIAAFAAVGFVVSRRKAKNAVGWLVLAIGCSLALTGAVSQYALVAYRFGHPGLPVARLAAFLAAWWVIFVALLPLPVLLFPDGRVPSSRWRFALRGYLVMMIGSVATIGVENVRVFTDRNIRVDGNGELVGHSSSTAVSVLGAVTGCGYVLFAVACVVHQVRAYRRSAGVHRAQLKWLLSGGVVSLAGLAASLFFSPAFALLAALPVSIGVGILRHRLYEIDRLISRTISYAIVTGFLVALFLGLVVLTTDVLPFSSPVGVAASTLAAASLFNPLRLRVQRVVDRRFNRARYDAEATVGAFARRLRDAVDLDTVETGLRDAVNNAVEPAHMTVWIRGSL